jgi:8-oxo-dGTP pyrophosphatase MutT (NUDIX family)
MGVEENHLQQTAAIPMRSGRVCLITSRNGKRWVIPKGCLEPGKTAGEMALQEAWEEAGLLGALEREPVGTYIYEKAGTVCRVTVFLMHVTEAREAWPEKSFRTRRWLSPARAMATVEDLGLRKLLAKVFGQEGVVVVAHG